MHIFRENIIIFEKNFHPLKWRLWSLMLVPYILGACSQERCYFENKKWWSCTSCLRFKNSKTIPHLLAQTQPNKGWSALSACRPPIGLWTCFFHKFPVSHHAIVNSLKWRVLVGQYFLVYLILIGWDRFLMALRPVLLIKTGNEITEEITRQATFLTVASLTHIIFAHK